MNEPLRIRVYPENGRWIAEGINCDIRLAFVSKERLYEMLRVKALEFMLAQLQHEARQYAFDFVMYGEETAVMRFGKKQTPAFRKLVAAELAKYGFNPEVQ